MNAFAMAQTAYSSPAAPIRTPQGSEYEAFAQFTRQLLITSKNKKQNFPKFAEALHNNRRLWRVLTIDIASPGNKLPDELRVKIFNLAEFTRKHTSRVLLGEADEAPLIEINTAMMRGLSSQGDRS